MSDTSKRFAPGWPLWLFVLAFMPILLSLGYWQLQRADEKQMLQAQMDTNRSALAQNLLELDQLEDRAWRPLQLQGEFDPEHIWLLDNRTRDGKAGVEVLQLFRDQLSAQPIVINRGWVAWPARRQLPSIDTPKGILQLDAEAVPQAEQGFTLGQQADATGWPRLITQVDLQRFAEEAAEPNLLSWSARLKIGSPAALTLSWPPLPTTASKHTAYAVQWFALALALLALFIWAGLRPEPRRNTQP
ncbi:MAG: SURF1 family protein [Pseudomonas sp.]